MAAKSKKPDKSREVKARVKAAEKLAKDVALEPSEPKLDANGMEPLEASESRAAQEAGIFLPPPSQVLTLPLLTDSATLFLQGAAQLTAQLIGQPECAPLLVHLNGWLDGLTKLKKLIVGDEDKIEGLKAKVITDGQPWGERGSRQLSLGGALVKVKAINYRAPDAPLTIADLDPEKVEAYLRGNAVDPEKTLAGYMKMTPTWGLKDLSPLQTKNLNAMLDDPGEWGQGLRQCLKETKYQMMAPEMENA